MRVHLPLMATVLLLAGCAPPCAQVCRKVLFDCELDSERVALDECEAACERQQALYDQWQDESLQELFDDHRRCIGKASCEELAEGVCYDGYEALFVFDTDKQPLPASTLFLEGEGYDDGAAVVGRVANAGGDELARATATVEAGAFQLVFPSVLEPTGSYTVEWFADTDADGRCAPGEADGAQRTTLTQAISDTDRRVAVDPATGLEPEACASFP